jgi:uncharacterized repeat protein (TIGR01451 family)
VPSTYIIVVTNDGPAAAVELNVQDAIPAGMTFNSVFISAGPVQRPPRAALAL